MSTQDTRSNGQALAGLFDINDVIKKGLQANPPKPNDAPAANIASPEEGKDILGLLQVADLQAPKRWEEAAIEGGRGKYVGKQILNELTGGFLEGALFPESVGDDERYKAETAQYATDLARNKSIENMKSNMPAFREFDGLLRDEDKSNDAEALYMMSKMFGADDNLLKQMYGQHGGRNPETVAKDVTYTEGDYQRINGTWNLVQQANDGSIKYTEMGPDFTPSNRMMSPDSLQKGLEEYQTASFGASQNEEDLDFVINTMDELGEDGWGATGFAGVAAEKWKEVTGTEDATTMARKTYDKIRTTRAIQNLPPGVASDKDVDLVMRPFPTGTMNYAELRDYMERLKRGEQKIREYNNFSSRYLSNKGKRDGMIDAWDSHWDELNEEGGKFYQEPKKEAKPPQEPLSPYIARQGQPSGDGGSGTGFDPTLLSKYGVSRQ